MPYGKEVPIVDVLERQLINKKWQNNFSGGYIEVTYT